MALESKKLFKPTPEQREQMLKIAAERGIDLSVRDDTNLRRFLKTGVVEPATKNLLREAKEKTRVLPIERREGPNRAMLRR